MLEIGSRVMVGYCFDLSKARKATVVAFENSCPNASRRVIRPVIQIDGDASTITLPGNAHEITCRSLMLLGAAIDWLDSSSGLC